MAANPPLPSGTPAPKVVAMPSGRVYEIRSTGIGLRTDPFPVSPDLSATYEWWLEIGAQELHDLSRALHSYSAPDSVVLVLTKEEAAMNEMSLRDSHVRENRRERDNPDALLLRSVIAKLRAAQQEEERHVR